MDAPVWHRMTRAGALTWALDHGGREAPVVLLHGLAGYAREWDWTAARLRGSHRVVAVEQRGHGRSERRPADVSRDAFVEDAAAWIERLGLAPAIVVGQSLGGHTAFLLASRRPELVRALVVADATPAADPEAPGAVREWLQAWPVPFADRRAAVDYFGGNTWGRAWADGLEPAPDGLRPAFDVDVMVAALEEPAARSCWDEWGRISCRTLVVRGETGIPEALAERMAAALPAATVAHVAGAGHDLHLEQPQRWHDLLTRFLG